MKELGGYFEFEQFHGSEYHENLLRFDSVRSSFIYTIQQRQYKKIYIPYYLCECVKELLLAYNIDYENYWLDKSFSPLINCKLNNNECLLFVNYFGRFNNKDLIELKERYNNIFIDNTQAFFQKPVREIDTAYSCRKYFGVTDGAYLNIELPVNDGYENLPYDLSHEKMLYVMGRYETSASQYYQMFTINEKICRGQPIKKMSLLIQNILKGIDYKSVMDKRNGNLKHLISNLNTINEIDVKNDAGLYFYPLLLKNNEGNYVKKKLIENKIYVPTLWPNVLNEVKNDTFEYRLASNIIFLPIDQRYNTDDMKYMIAILYKYI